MVPEPGASQQATVGAGAVESRAAMVHVSAPARSPDEYRASVDLNADLGELVGTDGEDSDAALLAVVTTAHIACGGHAGDAESMRRTVAGALAAGAAVGAHPSYPDRQGFGRRPMDRSPADVAGDVAQQVEGLFRVAEREGAVVRSVKPHGALYHRIADDVGCAEAVAEVVRGFGAELALVLRAGSVALPVAVAVGVTVVAEGFCDRGYLADGSLAPRSAPGALVTDPQLAAARALSLALEGRVEAVDGRQVLLDCQTLCLHGDAPGAVGLGLAIRDALIRNGVAVAPPPGGTGRRGAS